MNPSHIFNRGSFFKMVNISFPRKLFNLLSKKKFDGEGEISAYDHILWFLAICVNNDIFLCKIFYFTFQDHVNSCCDTLPWNSIHSFKPFIDEFIFDFQKSTSKDLFKEIDEFIRRPNESMNDFCKIFLNICYNILDKDKEWFHLIRNFPCTVGISDMESKSKMNIDSKKLNF